jgi:glycosyltransferase involved in cell wall biosynthesis
MVKRGHNVHVITQRLKDTKSSEMSEGITIHRVGSELKISGDFPVGIKYYSDYIIRTVIKGIALIRHNSESKGKIIIHSNPYIPSISAQICSRIFHIPHIVTFHDVFQAAQKDFWDKSVARDLHSAQIYSSKLPSTVRYVERLLLRMRVCKYHTPSEMSKLDMRQFGVEDNKISVIPHGLDPIDYKMDSHSSLGPGNIPSAVFMGRLIDYKNVHTVIRAFKIVVKSRPDVKLVIIGDGPQKDFLINEAKEIKENIIFTGTISHIDKLRLLFASSFVVFPSLIEGFGIAIIEAFACFKPVIVSNVRPLSDIVRDGQTGYVTSPFDIREWAENMLDLFNNVNTRKQMGMNSYHEFIKNYQLEDVVAAMEQLYKTCLG